MQRRCPCLTGAPRGTQKRDQKIVQQAALWCFTEDMQPVADLQLFQLAEKSIQLLQFFIFAIIRRDPTIQIEPKPLYQFEDFLGQIGETARVEAGGLVIFIDQRLKVSQGTIGLRPGQWRGQMIDDHRRASTLGLGTLAGIIDDERIEVR